MQTETQGQQKLFQPKQSPANKLWVLILLGVLTTLFLEMKGSTRHNFNCCISTNAETIGADVYIDAQKVGTVAKDEPGGLGGGSYRLLLPSGHHVIELKKPEFNPFTRDVEMKKELYMEANLSRSAG